MNDAELVNWEEFQKRVKELRAEYHTVSYPLLFRGQSNFEWPLSTTLERTAGKHLLFSDYHQLICSRMEPEVKTFAGVEVPDYKPSAMLADYQNRQLLMNFNFPSLPLYRYMVYLRHFGFPSPLLDWSRSPYVAAFFAFRDDPLLKIEKRSVFVYCKSRGGVTGWALGEPTIHPIGPYVQTHQRHFRQRCDYTLCGKWDTVFEQWRFDSHQWVFDHRRREQDLLWKFDLPSTERETVLRALSDYNLNAFSLFGSEESLLESLWVKEYELREPLS